MTGKQDLLDSGIKETQKIVDEYRDRIAQAFEAEREKLKKIAEEESGRIVVNAYQKAESIIEDARKEAQDIVLQNKNKAEDEYINKLAQAQKLAQEMIVNAEGEADKIIKEKSQREIQRLRVEAQRQSEKILSDAMEMAAQMVKEEQDRAAAEAREESSLIIKQAKQDALNILTDMVSFGTRRAEQHLEEMVKKLKTEFADEAERLLVVQETAAAEVATADAVETEEITDPGEETERATAPEDSVPSEQNEEQSVPAVTAVAEADPIVPTPRAETDWMKSVFEKFETKPVKEEYSPFTPVYSGTKETGTATMVAESEPGIETKDAVVDTPADALQSPVTPESPDPAAETAEGEIFQGRLNLEINAPFTPAQLEKLKESLAQVPGLVIVATGGSAEGKAVKAIYALDVKRPMPLPVILKEIPAVKNVNVRKGNIAINLRRA